MQKLLKNKFLKNSSWMILEKIVSVFGVVFVSSFVAKYIGPYLWGIISLSLSLFQIVQIIAQMGGDNLIFKRLTRSIVSGERLISSTFKLRTGIYIVFSIPVIAYWLMNHSGVATWYFLAIFVSVYFMAIDVYAIYNDARLKSKLNTIFNVIGLCVSLALRWGIAFFKMDAVWLCVPIILASFVPFALRYFYFCKEAGGNKKLTARQTAKYNKYLISAGFSIVLSTISISIYTRINQFLMAGMISPKELGIYSAALTLATSWGFINSSIITSYFSSIFAEKDINVAMKRITNLNRMVIGISLMPLLFIALFGKQMLIMLYGNEFSEGANILLILCLSVVVSGIGATSYRFIILQSGYKYLSVKMVFVMLFSVASAYFSVKYYGMFGAAVSVVLTELFSLTLANYFFKKGIVFKLHRKLIGL